MTRSPADAPLSWNVAGLLGDDPGASREFDVSDVSIVLDDGLELARPINGHVRFGARTAGSSPTPSCRPACAASAAAACAPWRCRSSIAIEEEFLPALDLATGKPLPIDAEPDVARLTDHHEIDLEPLVRDELVLAEPIAPLHSPDCAGLCIECGLPLDEGTHDHPTDDIDPRLEVLRGFTAVRDEDPGS